MESICQNCARIISENFCGHCGQKQFKRIDRKYIGDELQYTLVHTNKGFLYSVKQILRNPGKTAREFIDGNRINHYKPIGLTFILSGISTFISFKLLHMDDIMNKIYAAKGQNLNIMSEFLSFMSEYNAIIMLFYIPILALCSTIAFNDWKHKYYEHVVMNAFGLSFYTIFSIIFIYPILYFFRDNNQVFVSISTYGSVMILPMMFWFYKKFYFEKSSQAIALRIFIKTTLFSVAFIAIIFGGIISYVAVNGADGLKQFAPKTKPIANEINYK